MKPVPPIIPGSRTYMDIHTSSSGTNTFSSTSDSVGFFGKLHKRQHLNGTAKSTFSLLKNVGLVDCPWEVEQQIRSNIPGNIDEGGSVSVSDDGTTIAIGAEAYENENSVETGAVIIFVKINGLWEQQSILVPTFGQNLGYAVALSADGNILATGNDRGTVVIFVRTNGQWAEVQTIDYPDINFGHSVALSSDGTVLVIGATSYETKGGAFIFEKDDRLFWLEKTVLVGSNSSSVPAPFQGYNVAISSDGKTVISAGTNDNLIGAVWVFNKSGKSNWTETAKLVGSDYFLAGPMEDAEQGTGCDISPDGKTIVIGGPRYNRELGLVWMFELVNGSWVQTRVLYGSVLVHESYPEQGSSVVMTNDTVVIGAWRANNDKGGIYVLKKGPDGWYQQGPMLYDWSDGSLAPESQRSLSISKDGNTVVVGVRIANSYNGYTVVYTNQ
jgi:hypothetical protein